MTATATPAPDALDVALRPAETGDAALILDWRNSDFIMTRAASGRRIDRDEHERWFAYALNDPTQRVLIILIAGAPSGLTRFERSGDDAIISVYLTEPQTGSGRGIAAIRLACAQIALEWPGVRVVAQVRRDNQLGLRAFPKAGFVASPDNGTMPDHVIFTFPTAQNAT